MQAALAQVDGLLAKRQFHAALDRLKGLIEQFPGQPGLLFLGARTAVRLEELALAARWLGRLCMAPPPAPDMGIEVTRLLRQCGQLENAKRYLIRLRQAHPANISLLLELGDVAKAMGDGDQARALILEVLERAPGTPQGLVFLARDRQSDPESVLSQVKRAQAAAPESAELNFAAGRCHERLDQHRLAFLAYREGNRRYRSGGQDFGIERKIDAAPGFVAEFTAEGMARWTADGHPSRVPVFVVGMPRSGTTLIEQIIASHPEADAVGERRIIGNLLLKSLSLADPGKPLLDSLASRGLKVMGQNYLDLAESLLGGLSPRVVDKMPFNFSLVGPCHLIFPQATLVHAQRDPLDVCWSMFTTGFRAEVLRFSLAEIGQLYALHEYLMAYWKQVCPVIELRYETLVSAFPAESARLVDAVGLDWHDDCLSFHQRKADVRTASAAQVRQPIYSSSVHRAAPYRQWMGEFEQAREQTHKSLGMTA